MSTEFCLYSQHGWVSCNLLVVRSRISYLFHLAPLGRALPPLSHPDGWGCLSPPALFQRYGAAGLVPIALVRAVTQSSVPSMAFSCTTGHNWSTRKMKESVGPLKDVGNLVAKDMGKVQSLDAFFALVHWRSPPSGLPNTCGWWQSLPEWGTACSTNRSDYEPVLWTGHVQGYGTSWASDAPGKGNQSYCEGALWPF